MLYGEYAVQGLFSACKEAHYGTVMVTKVTSCLVNSRTYNIALTNAVARASKGFLRSSSRGMLSILVAFERCQTFGRLKFHRVMDDKDMPEYYKY